VVPLFFTREGRLTQCVGGFADFYTFYGIADFPEVKTRDFSTVLLTHLRDSIFRLTRLFFQLFNKSTVQEKSRIRDKHPGSATLIIFKLINGTLSRDFLLQITGIRAREKNS
jgi:hypothetical protein